jgi:hypothetical protein
MGERRTPVTAPNLTFDCAEVARDLANFAVGFGKITVNANMEDAIAAGSGTLVTIGSIDGILTAAHVLEALPNRGEVALLRFPNRLALPQKQTIDMSLAERVIISADEYNPNGPDLGFLRLPPLNAQNLRATNSFRDISSKRDAVTASQPGTAYVDAVVGVVAEWTKDLPSHPSTRLKSFDLLFCCGTVVANDQVGNFDVYTFKPDFESPISPPSTYGGVSGGGLWRIYFIPDGSNRVLERRLIGAAFYELRADDALRVRCHGPGSVYDRLIGKVLERWPQGPAGMKWARQSRR